jgi:hypothetical protein
VTLSGRFWRNRILFGGRYSSGIWTLGRLGAGAAAAPSTAGRMSDAAIRETKQIVPSAAIRFARNFCFRGFVYRVVSARKS